MSHDKGICKIILNFTLFFNLYKKIHTLYKFLLKEIHYLGPLISIILCCLTNNYSKFELVVKPWHSNCHSVSQYRVMVISWSINLDHCLLQKAIYKTNAIIYLHINYINIIIFFLAVFDYLHVQKRINNYYFLILKKS